MKKKINRCGIDRITLTNIFDQKGKFPEPLIDYFQKLTDKDLKKDPFVTLKRSKIIFVFGNFSLIFGNYASAYANIEIHAADENGNNFFNMSMNDILKKLPEILEFFQTRYGIKLNKISEYKISKLEINATIEMKSEPKKYEDCMRLLQYGFNGSNGSYATYYRRNNILPEVETMYLVDSKKDNKNYSIKVYDKIREAKDKNCDLGEYSRKNFLRFEIIIKKQCELKLIVPTLYFLELNDEKIRNYFQKRFDKAINKVEAFLFERIRNPLDIGDGITLPSIAELLMDTILEKGIHAENIAGNFFGKIIEIEHLLQLPVFLSVLELKKVIQNEMFLSKRNVEICTDMLKSEKNLDIKKDPFIEVMYQREALWYEMKYKLGSL